MVNVIILLFSSVLDESAMQKLKSYTILHTDVEVAAIILSAKDASVVGCLVVWVGWRGAMEQTQKVYRRLHSFCEIKIVREFIQTRCV